MCVVEKHAFDLVGVCVFAIFRHGILTGFL